MPVKVAVLCLARPTFDVPYAQEIADQALSDLGQRDFEVIGDSTLLFDPEATLAQWRALKAQKPDRLLLLQVTFADASMAVTLAQDWGQCVHIVGFEEPRTGGRLRLNSFCGVNLAVHAFNRHGLPYRANMRSGGGAKDFLSSMTPEVASLGPDLPNPGLAPDLQSPTLVRLGDHPAGFDTCRVDELALSDTFGVTVEAQPIQALFERAQTISDDQITAQRVEAQGHLGGLEDVDQDELNKAFAASQALEELCDGKAGVAVRCWPETFTEYGCAVCGGMARMNGKGVPASCEADVPGTLTSLVMQTAARSAALLVDIVDFDAGSDTAVVWHCGLAPIEMAGTPPEATIHSNRKKPLLHQFALKPGTVTLARLSQIGNRWTMILGTAEMVDAPRAFGGTAGTVTFDEPATTVRDRLLALGLEHHVSIVYGDIRAELLGYAAQHNLPVLSLC